MKIILCILASLALTTSVFCQVPQAFKYQTVLRTPEGVILGSQEVSLKVDILKWIKP